MILSKTNIPYCRFILLLLNFSFAYLYIYKQIFNMLFDRLEANDLFAVPQSIREAIVYFTVAAVSVVLSYPRLKKDGFHFSAAQVNDALSIMFIAVFVMLATYMMFGKYITGTGSIQSGILLRILISAVASPIIEEIFFRYTAYEFMCGLVPNKIITVLLVSILFALPHLRSVSPDGGALYFLFIYCVLGISYQAIYIKTASLPLCICVHSLWNFFTIVGLPFHKF